MNYEIKTLDELQVGDEIPTVGGEYTRVNRIHDKVVFQSTFELETTKENGEKTSITLSGDHLLYTVSDLDKQWHPMRKRKGKQVLSKVPDDDIRTLEEIASIDDTKDEYETTVFDIVSLLTNERTPKEQVDDVFSVVLRCAQSVGHVSENQGVAVDAHTGEKMDYVPNPTRMYPAKLLAQQVLSLQAKSPYETLVGRVITVEEVADLMNSGVGVEIPEA